MHVVKHLFKFVERITPRVNSDVSYELLITVTYICMLTNCNKGTTTVGVGDMGNLYAFCQFCCGPKNALKKKVKVIFKKCIEQNFRNNRIH